MCGIIGLVAKEEFGVRDELLKGLKRLEYRGYDSSGFATSNGDFVKTVGEINNLLDNVDKTLKARTAIAHTRWATHGGVTEINSHPHFNKEKTLFVVHNGIIENFQKLKEDLELEGYEFISQTDTEVIVHFLDSKIKQGKSVKEALLEFEKTVKGTYAILAIKKDEEKIYALKKDSPLALGITKTGFVLGSDIYAFSDKTKKAIFFDDNELAEITAEKYAFFDKEGNEIVKAPKTFEWEEAKEQELDFAHYMIKEIKEQPKTSKRLIESLHTLQKDKLKEFAKLIKDCKKLFFIAAGTSYHASLIGAYLFNNQGIDARTMIASEFENFSLVDKDTLIIPISQSGETMDVVSVLKEIKKAGAKVASIINVPYSTIQRHSDLSIETLAGQEVCVASTKTFTNQLIVLFALAKELGYEMDIEGIPDKIQKTIDENEEKTKEIAKELSQKRDIFILGKGATYPIAREIALKLKEIDYIHASGMMAGELKHGTIALIEDGTPVISLIPKSDLSMDSSTKEVEARGAKTIIISNNGGDFIVPDSDDAEFAVYSTMIGHLLSYYIGVELNLPIDKPRNLAKSVTVK